MFPHRARTTLALALGVASGAALGLVFSAPPLAAQEAPTSPARYEPPPGIYSKEFTLVRTDGWFHVFYLRDNPIPGAPALRSFGHAISRDLYTWSEQDTILTVVPGTFEATQVWAPSLHRVDGTWFLFYPGMRHEPAQGYIVRQAISYATSPDLYTWTRREFPLFDNRLFPWAYFDSTSGIGGDCRDPFLWWDAIRGEWLLYVATRPASRPQNMVIGIAGSGDLEHWSDRGLVPITLPDVSFSDVAESPHVFTRNDSLLLFMWTTDSGQSLNFGRSTDPVTGWTMSRRLRSMLGYSTSGWWGSEMLEDGDRWYFATVHNTWVDFWDATWTAADTFRLTPPDPLQLLSARLVPDAAAAGDTVTLEVVAVNAAGRAAALSLTRRQGAASTPLDPALFALPESLSLAGDTTRASFLLPALAGNTPFLVDVFVAAGTSVGDTLTYIGSPPSQPGDPLVPDPELPIIRVVRPRNGMIRFVRAEAAGGPRAGDRATLVVDVRDVRGRRVWRGEGDGFARALEWRTDGGGGRTRVAPGIYFARVLVAGHSLPARLKVVVLP